MRQHQRLKEISRRCEFVLVRKSDVNGLGAEDPDATRSSLVNRLRNYLARHRLSALVKKEVARLEAQAEKVEGRV